jgi:multiple sugar transport system substrate-binding protein
MEKIKNKDGRLVAVFTVVLLMAGLLTGSQVVAKEKTTISFHNWMIAEAAGAVESLEWAEKRFETLNPQVDIEMVPLSWEDTPVQLMLMMTAGNAPDVTLVDGSHIGQYVAQGGIQALDDFISPELKNGMLEAAYEHGVMKGKLYALCWNPNPEEITYNKGLLKKAGFESPPTTMDDLNEQVAKISQLAPDIYGILVISYIGTEPADWFHIWLWNFGGDMIDETGKIVCNEKGAVDAVTWFKGLTDKNYCPKGYNTREGRVLFSKDKIGLMVEGSWIRGILQELGMKDEQWALSTIPSSPFTGKIGATPHCDHMLVMSKQSKHKDVTYKWMEFIVSDPEFTRMYYQGTGLLPVMASAYEDDIYNTPFVRTCLEQMEVMKVPGIFAFPEKAALERFFMIGIQQVMMEGRDPQEALDEVAKNMKILLGR